MRRIRARSGGAELETIRSYGCTRITQEINAARTSVYRALTDAREGGSLRIWMR